MILDVFWCWTEMDNGHIASTKPLVHSSLENKYLEKYILSKKYRFVCQEKKFLVLKNSWFIFAYLWQGLSHRVDNKYLTGPMQWVVSKWLGTEYYISKDLVFNTTHSAPSIHKEIKLHCEGGIVIIAAQHVPIYPIQEKQPYTDISCTIPSRPIMYQSSPLSTKQGKYI